MDYEKIGFKAGLEIHQQLDTHKLFCQCQSQITEDTDYSFERLLRPTQSEMGDVDQAAFEEAKRKRRFRYVASSQSTCLVEADEEPPHAANKEAIDLCLTVALLLNAKPVDEVQFMRKIVIDGSNTTGFQRTALIAMDGKLHDVGIQLIALEEDAARKLVEKEKVVTYGLDRLGIPLVEIATAADIRSPQHARETAEKIGSVLHATGKVKKGLGTIRQDVNISIAHGARVEIKGMQSLRSIVQVAHKEVLRQRELLEIRDMLNRRIHKKDLETIEHVEITSVFKDCKSTIVSQQLKKTGCAKGIRLPGFHGLLKREHTQLGRELAVYARITSGIGGIIHSDKVPGHGITTTEIKKMHQLLGTNEHDAFVIAFGKASVADAALDAVVQRAKGFFDGVPEEVRRSLPDDTTEYMRPLPGAARMYPETDVPPVRISPQHIQRIRRTLPEKPEEKQKRFVHKYKLNREQTKQLLASGYEHDFERLVTQFPNLKNTIIRTFLNTFSELEKEGIEVSDVQEDMLIAVFSALSKGAYAKEAIPEILKYLLQNRDASLEDAIAACGLQATDQKEILKTIQRIVSEREAFVRQRGTEALGPLMGVVMQELRGKVDGNLISTLLLQEIKKLI